MRTQVESAGDVGDHVRRVRHRHGLSQVELAQRLGATQRYISELEQGKPKRADDKYFTVLRKLGIRIVLQSDA